jgi:hypothetical protein
LKRCKSPGIEYILAELIQAGGERFLSEINNLINSIWIVLYGYETWSVILKREHTLKVFGNRVLRRIFGPKRDEIIGGWRKLHIEGLHNLCSSPNIIKIISVGGWYV